MSIIVHGKRICTYLRAIDGSVEEIHLIDAVLFSLTKEVANKVEMLTTMGETDMLKILNQLLMAESASTIRKMFRGRLFLHREAYAGRSTAALVAKMDMA